MTYDECFLPHDDSNGELSRVFVEPSSFRPTIPSLYSSKGFLRREHPYDMISPEKWKNIFSVLSNYANHPAIGSSGKEGATICAYLSEAPTNPTDYVPALLREFLLQRDWIVDENTGNIKPPQKRAKNLRNMETPTSIEDNVAEVLGLIYKHRLEQEVEKN